MKEITSWEYANIKEDALYWVFDSIRQDIVLATYSSRNFYYYNLHDPYGLQLTRATHYKAIRKPKFKKR